MASTRSSFLFLISSFWLFCSHVLATEFLNTTVTAGVNGTSTIQCWQLSSPFVSTGGSANRSPATTKLGDLANGTYSLLPGGFNFGSHVAPFVQYVILLSGKIEVTAPGNKQAAIIKGGRDGFLFAADTASQSTTGHVTIALENSILLQIPTKNGTVPPHTVLHNGACKGQELPP